MHPTHDAHSPLPSPVVEHDVPRDHKHPLPAGQTGAPSSSATAFQRRVSSLASSEHASPRERQALQPSLPSPQATKLAPARLQGAASPNTQKLGASLARLAAIQAGQAGDVRFEHEALVLCAGLGGEAIPSTTVVALIDAAAARLQAGSLSALRFELLMSALAQSLGGPDMCSTKAEIFAAAAVAHTDCAPLALSALAVALGANGRNAHTIEAARHRIEQDSPAHAHARAALSLRFDIIASVGLSRAGVHRQYPEWAPAPDSTSGQRATAREPAVETKHRPSAAQPLPMPQPAEPEGVLAARAAVLMPIRDFGQCSTAVRLIASAAADLMRNGELETVAGMLAMQVLDSEAEAAACVRLVDAAMKTWEAGLLDEAALLCMLSGFARALGAPAMAPELAAAFFTSAAFVDAPYPRVLPGIAALLGRLLGGATGATGATAVQAIARAIDDKLRWLPLDEQADLKRRLGAVPPPESGEPQITAADFATGRNDDGDAAS